MFKIVIGSIICAIVFGCASTGKLMKLQLDMTKPQVIKAIGKPNTFRGSMKNKYEQTIEVYEYGLYKTSNDAYRGLYTYYWLLFVEGYLVQWGEAGDWKEISDQIYEIRYR